MFGRGGDREGLLPWLHGNDIPTFGGHLRLTWEMGTVLRVTPETAQTNGN